MEISQVDAHSLPVQLQYCMDAEVSISSFRGADQGGDGARHSRLVRMEGGSGAGVERAAGSCASCVFDSAEAVGVGVHRLSGGASWR